MYVNVIFSSRALNALPSDVALGIADTRHLREPCESVADVACVFKGLFTLRLRRKLNRR